MAGLPLFIRSFDTDDGARPPGGLTNTWWLSPDLFLATLQGNGVLGASTASLFPGSRYAPRVVVRNFQPAYGNVWVQVWLCDFGTAPATVAKTWTLGPQAVPAKAPGSADPSATVFEAPTSQTWTAPPDPTPADPGSHFCLMANVYAKSDGGALEHGAPLAGAPPAVDVPNNSHHAQHNLAYRSFPPWHDLLQEWIGVTVANQGLLAARFAVEVRPAPRRPRFVDALHAQGLVRPGLQLLDRARVRTPTRLMRGFGSGDLAVVRDVTLVGDRQSGRRLTLDLEPGETSAINVNLRLFAGRHPGLTAFDVVQRERRSGRTVGGARIVVARVPPLLVDAVHTRETDGSPGQ